MILKVKLSKTLFISLFISIVSVVILLFSVNVLSVFASTEGMLRSSDNSTLKIYPQPNVELPEIATANVGDRVFILEKAYNNQAEVWDRIRLVDYTQIEGWISDSYVVSEDKGNNDSDPYDPSNYYEVNQFNFEGKN